MRSSTNRVATRDVFTPEPLTLDLNKFEINCSFLPYHEIREGVEDIERKGGNKVEKEPGPEIVDHDLSGAGNNLTLLIDEGCPEVQEDI